MGRPDNVARAVLAAMSLCGCDVVWRIDSFGDLPTDAQGDAGSDAAASTPNIAFVSSMKIAPANLGGVAGADALCTQLAGAAGFDGTYVAWLSSSSEDARSRLEATVPRGWVRPDGKPFADTIDDITHHRIFYALQVTEAKADLATAADTELVVATGTGPDGRVSSGQNCLDFGGATGVTTVGSADGGAYAWTNTGTSSCTTPARIYCFGTDHNTPVSVVPESTRLAFVTQADLAPPAGRPYMDQQCQTEAQLLNHPGTFHAALPTSADTALSRFALGTPWVRTDHVTVIDASGARVAPIILDSADSLAISATVFGGAPKLDARPGSPSETCGDWSAYSTLALKVGDAARSGLAGFGGIVGTCNFASRVYCLQD